MHIAYCTNVRLPSERAHGHQIAQVCDALANLGHTVTLFAPYRRNPVTASYHQYYGANEAVELQYLGSFDPINRSWLPGVLGLWTLNILLRLQYRAQLRMATFDLLYTRTPALLPALLGVGTPVVLELHSLPRYGRARFVSLAAQCRLVVCLTSAMRRTLEEWGVPADRLTVEGDAVDLQRFVSMPAKQDARADFGIQTDALVVGYVGRLKTLGMEKGVFFLLQALALLQGDGRFFGCIVGGPEGDTDAYRAEARSLGLSDRAVLFTGEIPASRVPSALAACDILAMPFPDFPHYRNNMSPLKLFEYMAADRPIVSSDLPTIRDVLSEETAYFCAPGDASSLADALISIADALPNAHARAARARFAVENHTWIRRMDRILTAVQQD